MKCTTCDYRLWNLRSQSCPECGTPFRSSEHEFAPNTVAFCCPRCDQAYYGRDERGHLTPRQFTCVTCGEALDMDRMVLRPASDLDEQQTLPDRNPWASRADGRWLAAWWGTVVAAMGRPGRLLRVTPRADAGNAWSFAAITLFVTTLVTAASLFLVLMVPLMLSGPHAGGADILMPLAFMVIGQVTVTLVMVLAWGLVTHGILRVGGAPAAGLGRTYQALCYTHGVTLVSAVPCIGFYLAGPAWIWWAVGSVFAVKEAQQVTGGRAVVAVLALPAALTAGFCALLAYGMVMAFVGFNAVSSSSMSFGPTLDMQSALQFAAHQYGGRPPEHASELLQQSMLSPDAFIDFGHTGTRLADVPVGSHNLDAWPMLSLAERRAAINDATAALGPNDEPYRFGDYVFTYRGLNLHQDAGDLWIAIRYHDPDHNPSPGQIHVLRIDGATVQLSDAAFQQALQQQNQQRAALGLPPIPDPATLRTP
ncbi:MAG: hypothetical protein WDZ31_13225 [Phycisphaeraceae bacterium]